jgi:hypothetical protein
MLRQGPRGSGRVILPYVTEVSLFSAAFIAAYAYLGPASRRGDIGATLQRAARWLRRQLTRRRG